MDDETLDHIVPAETGDGSTTLIDQRREISYRSQHGAIQESKHVFLEGTGIVDRNGPWRVVELGFGAAVNFVQTVRAFRDDFSALRLIYHSIDWRPVTSEHLAFHGHEESADKGDDEQPDPENEAAEMARSAVDAIHGGDGPVTTVESEDGKIVLHLHARPWEDAKLTGIGAHAFYHDPFSKRINPESWTAASFVRAKKAMAPDGRLATYSAATSVKEAMFEAGLWVASAPGPGRKREMTVASPSRAVLERAADLEMLDRAKYLGES